MDHSAQERIIVNFDGLCEPVNPGGVATFGFVISKDGHILTKGHAFLTEGRGASNNSAEYGGLIASLKWLIANGYNNGEVEVKGDSKLVVHQMSGSWRAKKGAYLEGYKEARELRDQFAKIRFSWVPREDNKEADRLSRRAYEEYCIGKGRAPVYSKH